MSESGVPDWTAPALRCAVSVSSDRLAGSRRDRERNLDRHYCSRRDLI